MSEVSISSDECGGNKTQEDPVICLASNRVNKQNRAPIRMSDYLRLEEHGIINWCERSACARTVSVRG